jgi:hypothetical protein
VEKLISNMEETLIDTKSSHESELNGLRINPISTVFHMENTKICRISYHPQQED